MIDRLVDGLAAGADLSAEEMLDVLWLAASSPVGRAAPPSWDEGSDEPISAESGSEPAEDDIAVPVPAEEPEPTLHLGAETAEGGGQTPATEIGFGAPRPIRDALTLPMALRRLRQVRAPGPRLAVDIDATVDATAEARHLTLVLGRPQERALDLALVVDDAPPMRIWDDTFDDLERLLSQTGAFRAVSRWRLDARSGAIRPAERGAAQPPQRLIDPSGRRLVLVATDARAQAWYTAPPWDAVAAWCEAMPTALVQVLPPHYWPLTAVGDPYITTRARRPAAPNERYDQRIAWWASHPGGPPLPVVTLTPGTMDAWAQAVVNGTAWTSGITATPPDPEHAPEFAAETEPGALVNEFVSRASSGAQRLARILASAAALSMPLITVLRDRLAPETGVLELAEVLASDLLTETSPAHGRGEPLLRFRPGTRELLRRGTTTFEEWDAYAAVSQYLRDRQHLGGPLRALVPDVDGTAVLDAADEPFAALHQALATRLGLRSQAADEQPQPDGGQDSATGESGEPATDETGEAASGDAADSPGDESPEPPPDLGPALGEEDLSAFIAEKIDGLADGSEFMIAGLNPLGPHVWRVARDDVGTPTVYRRSISPSEEDQSWDDYIARLARTFAGASAFVRNPADYSRDNAYAPLEQIPGITVFESETPVEELLLEAVQDSTLTRGYELAVLSEGPNGRVLLESHPLFPAGVSSGYRSAPLRIRCAPPPDGRAVFATVAEADPDADRSTRLISAQSAVLAAGEYTVTATLVRPGIVAFDGLPAELQDDEGRWEAIVRGVPARMAPPDPVHLIWLLETSGDAEQLQRRIDFIEEVITRLTPQSEWLAMSLVTYWPHSVRARDSDKPPAILSWEDNGPFVLNELATLNVGRRMADDDQRAAQLECALREVRNRLVHGPAGPGRPVLVTVGGRPPHPPRIDALTEIAPCRYLVDWRHQVAQLRNFPGITSFAVPDDSFNGKIWRTVGWNGVVDQRTDIDALVDAVGIRRRMPPAPFPMIVRETVFNQLADNGQAAHAEVASESVETGDGAELEASLVLANGEIAEEQREPAPPPASSPREAAGAAGIALLGPPASGKSTFLAALQIALLRRTDEDWGLLAADEETTRALVESTSRLTRDHQFPYATLYEDVRNLVLRGSSERTVRRGFFRRAEKSKQQFSIQLKLTDLAGEYFTSSQAADAVRPQAIDQVYGSQGILYMFDPTREAGAGDVYESTYAVISQLADIAYGGRLPHYLAVCVTKFDDPLVFRSAERANLIRAEDPNPPGFPRVANADAKQFFKLLCDYPSRAGSARLLGNLFDRYFHQDRVRYFVTSSVGFYVDPGTGRFDFDDYQNTVLQADHNWAIRGRIYPINVAEPVLWLADRITKSSAASLARPDES